MFDVKEKTVIVAMHPRDCLQEMLCARTCDLAPYLDDIQSVKLLSKETTPQGLIRHRHHWRARANVPPLLAQHIDSKVLEWIGRVEWRANEYVSRWIVEPGFMRDSVACEAVMNLSAAVGGRGTRLDLELDITAVQIPAGFQTILGAILKTHFRKMVDAAGKVIEDG